MDYVIAGAGPAGVIAAETLRRTDADGRITLVAGEPEPPYSRMAIPYLLAENIGEEGTHLRHQPGHYETLGIEVVHARVGGLDPAAKRVTLDDGRALAYDRLLLATGAHPIRPPIPGMDLPGIESCWTLADARRIAAAAHADTDVVLMGAGFIGCIVLEALVARGVRLTVVEMADRMLARMMDETGADMLERWCEAKGVRVRTATRVTAVEPAGSRLRLTLDRGDGLEADLVVCATGVTPNLDFLAGSGVETDQGIVVDHHLRTSVDDIFAAGDVAQGPVFGSDAREVHAIQPTASEHGRLAALNMAGHNAPYRGSLAMNVLATMGLISSSFGQWMGVEGGERAVAADRDGFKYMRLEFDDDVLVGALTLGFTQHVGAIRGLVQTRPRLGKWKDALMADPTQVMSAYLAATQPGV